MRCGFGLTILVACLERALNAGAELAVHPRLLHTSLAFRAIGLTAFEEEARKTLDPDARKILDRWINRNCRRKE